MRHLSAKKAWAGLGVYVLVTDYVLIRNGKATMSAQYALWTAHRTWRFVAGGIAGYLLLHLYQWPKAVRVYDPLGLLATRLRNGKVDKIGLLLSEPDGSLLMKPIKESM